MLKTITFIALAFAAVIVPASLAQAQSFDLGGFKIEVPDFVNPVIHNSGTKPTEMVYDYTTGTWKLKTEQTQIHNSALDKDRNIIDPGSLRNVNYYTTDSAGNRVHVTGKTWRSNGKPHSQITRKIVRRDSQGNQWTEEVHNLKSGNPGTQPQFNPHQQPINPNQPQFNPNQQPFHPNQPQFNPHQPQFPAGLNTY